MSDLLNSASLVMIPSGYKEDTVFSAIPTDGSGDLSFTRASNGTRINSAGLVEVVPWNLLTYSSVLSDSSYTISELSRTDSQTDPNGGNTGALFTGTSATNAYILKSFSTIIGQVYTCSVYLKGNSSGSVSIRVDGAGTAPVNNVNYTTSYQQFTYTFTADSTTSTLIIGGYNTWLGSEAIYVAFPQANIGATAKPYFPTTDRLNVPRLTYQNGGGGCPSLLLEKQSTNLLSYSEQFDDAVWSKNSASITANTTTSPDGTTNADTLTLTALSGHIAQLLTKSASAITYTLSCYIKAGTSSLARISMSDYLTGQADGIINLSTQTITASNGTWSSASASINNMGNGWYYCRLTATSPINGFVFTKIQNDGANSTTIQIWGAQLEASSYPTSYIPTTSSSATRIVDVCSKTGISSLIGQSEGVLFADVNIGQINVASDRGIISVGVNGAGYTSAIYVSLYNNDIYLIGFVGGTPQFTGISKTIPSIGRYKIAVAYKQNDFVMYINGEQIGTRTSGNIPSTLSVFGIGNINTGFYGDFEINQTAIFPTRLSNSDLQALTA